MIAQSVANIYSLAAVAPGGSTKYEWLVPDSAGPGPADGDAVAYAYVSGADHIKHINAGLVGALVVYGKGMMPKGGSGDVMELPMLFNIQNEMQSEMYDANVAKQRAETKLDIKTTVRAGRGGGGCGALAAQSLLRTKTAGCQTDAPAFLTQSLSTHVATTAQAVTFPESNLMHGINGYLWCNGPAIQLESGQKLRLFIMGFGSEVDMHSPIFSGQTITNRGRLNRRPWAVLLGMEQGEWHAGSHCCFSNVPNIACAFPHFFLPLAGTSVYSVGVMPSTTFVVELTAGKPGAWDYYCNILDHINAGMKARMVVS